MRADLTYCDFLVLAPLQLEIDALVLALEKAGWVSSTVDVNGFQRVIEATFVDSALVHFRRRVVIVQLNHQGVLNASVDTARALELYEPGYVVSFGIAGTLNWSDAPIGAVVFATSLFYYEPSKDELNSTQSRMDPIKVGDTLMNPFRKIVLANVARVDGPFASGEKLFADIASSDRKRIVATNDKTLGVEMEAAGVGRAVNRLSPAAEFLVIKGISDEGDKRKNRVSPIEQARNRTTAASNAASCLIQLMRNAPLRRVLRGFPRPFEEAMAQKAMAEAKQISDILEPFGITANYTQLYACLYGRRGPVPAYFHWKQYTPALHWIDFKILTAIRLLPREMVTPTPFVTIGAPDILSDQSWYSSVYTLLGVHPITNDQIEGQREELFQYIHRVGFNYSAEEDIRIGLEKLRHTGRPEITLNLMRYMLGQCCHRRMFVFTWKSYRAKWEQLSQAIGTWFSIFEWDTLTLGGKLGKQEPPGQDLLIEPESYTALNDWLATSPSLGVVQEFVDHFSCHRELCGSPSSSQLDPRKQLKALMQCWDRVFFGQE